MEKSELLKKAIDFHGHTGVFLAVGLRMGDLAKETLGGNCFAMKALIKTELHPPRSCLLDGVQVATGCTLGKMNISAEDSDKLLGVFSVGDNRVEIEVKESFLHYMKEKMLGRDREHLDDLTEETMEMDTEKLFLVTRR